MTIANPVTVEHQTIEPGNTCEAFIAKLDEPNILVIPGTSKVNHAKGNAEAADILLSTEEMTELGKF